MPVTDITDLYELHGAAIRAYCRRRLEPDDVDDAVSEVFVVAVRRVADIPDGGSAVAWLYGVAHRVISTRHRSVRRRRSLQRRLAGVRPEEPPEPDQPIVRRAEYDHVAAALNELREADREILHLAAWEGLGSSDIAVALGCSPDAAAQRLSRAKARLGREYRRIAGVEPVGGVR